ncbi:sugar transferase [Novosphingobium bradum]|uniref:Sugar transferase n=1 Tax=Novosphingobium bradum TaxID=1737444 RepID=A0ABV7IPE8_9SPHN
MFQASQLDYRDVPAAFAGASRLASALVGPIIGPAIGPAIGPSASPFVGCAGGSVPGPFGDPAQPLPDAVPGTFATPREIALPPLAASRTGQARRPVLAMAAPIPIRRGFIGWEAALKRLFDLAAATILLALVLPLLVAVAAALWVDSPGPVLFVQRRLGRDGRLFGCIKLRTMRVDAESQLARVLAACPRARREWEMDRKLRNDPRVSRLGRLVRKLSLDELPQLANVLAGEMSMVGPRPIVQAEIPRYGAFLADYCAVKPGITGLWQVSGRNDVSYGERVQLDRHYSRHASVLLDLRIVLRTIPAVLLAQGSY